MLITLWEWKVRRMGEKKRKKEKVQSVYPGQSLKIYSNPINQKSLDILKLYRSHFWSQNLK